MCYQYHCIPHPNQHAQHEVKHRSKQMQAEEESEGMPLHIGKEEMRAWILDGNMNRSRAQANVYS